MGTRNRRTHILNQQVHKGVVEEQAEEMPSTIIEPTGKASDIYQEITNVIRTGIPQDSESVEEGSDDELQDVSDGTVDEA